MLECDSKWRLKQRTRQGSAGLWEQLLLFSQLILFCGPILLGVYYRQVNNAQLPLLFTYLSRTHFLLYGSVIAGYTPFWKKNRLGNGTLPSCKFFYQECSKVKTPKTGWLSAEHMFYYQNRPIYIFSFFQEEGDSSALKIGLLDTACRSYRGFKFHV